MDHRSLTMPTIMALVAITVLAGCATNTYDPTSPDPAVQWETGKKQVERGEKLVNRGQDRLSEGRRQVRDGEAMIVEGSEAVETARKDYQSKSLSAGGSTSPDQVEYESKALRAVAKRWEDALEQIKDGNALVTRGNKNIDRGQTEIREGRSAIDAGSTLMRNGERALAESVAPSGAGGQ